MVVRVPIKLRKSVHKEFCSCWGIKVLSILSVPHLFSVDNLSDEQVVEFLDSTDVAVPVYFSSYTEDHNFRINQFLSRKIPVVIKTNSVIPSDILRKMKEVPHSGIHVSINFLDDLIKNRLEGGGSSIDSIREMLFLAKSWKIFSILTVDYQPHLVPKLDLFEIIDEIKNFIPHVIINFPSIDDEHLLDNKHKWEALAPSSMERFKQFYMADVPTRTWMIRDRYKEDILETLQEFVKNRKITLEVVGDYCDSSNRVRYAPSGLSKLPLGVRPFFYKKEGIEFLEVPSIEGESCPKCGKPIFS